MALFAKTVKNPGWMAIVMREEGLCAAHVVRQNGSRPAVQAAVFFPWDGASRREVLEKACRELQMNRYRCTTVLAEKDYQLLSIEAPNAPPEELKNAVRWKLKDLLDFRVEEAAVDVLPVPLDRSAAARNRALYAIAARNTLIRDRQVLFEQARIPLSVIDIPEMAQRNISSLLEPEGRGLALLSFDAEGGMLTVTAGSELYLSRRIEVSVGQLAETDSEKRNACFDRITLELQRSLDHFDRQYQSVPISRLMLPVLGDVGLALQSYLAQNLYVPVEIYNLSTIFDFSSVPELLQPALQQRFYMALGCGLRHEEKLQ